MSHEARREADSGRMPKPAKLPFPRIVRRRLAPDGSLAGDLLSGAITGLFPSSPGELPRAEELRRRSGAMELPAGAFIPTSEGAQERLDKIAAGEGVVVTTGQQPGLFLGPLYTLYKGLTAVSAAARLERECGIPALAVFWVASDDHDWEEVAACHILDRSEELRTLRLEPPHGHAERSVGTAPLPADVTSLLRTFRAETDGAVAGASPPWLDELREAYVPGRSFGEAFVRALGAAFDGLDLAVVDSAHPALRTSAAELYGEIVESPARIIEAMSVGRDRVADTGHAPILTPPESGLQIFFDDGRARRHLLGSDEDVAVGDETIPRSELLERLASDPDAFTPAAALRPVVESRLLPVAATVLGPGEISYWAQLPPLFDALGVPMPRIVPREAWALVEPPVDRLLEKLDLDVATVESEGEGIDDRWVQRRRPPDVRDALSALETELAAGFDRVDDVVADALPGLKSAAGKARHRVEEALGELSHTVDARVRERERIALGQAARLRSHLLPGGRPQERVIVSAQFLGRHGRPLMRDLLDACRVAGPGERA